VSTRARKAYENAVTAANQLIAERDGDLEGPALRLDFNVVNNVDSEHVELRIGGFPLWDSDKDDVISVKLILAVAKEELRELSESFKRWA
jgi:hypothetical protein